MIEKIKNSFKKLILNFIFKSELKNRPKKKYNKFSNNSSSIAVIVDSNINISPENFDFLTNIFSTPENNIRFLWYQSPIFYDRSNHMRIYNTDLSFSGVINKDFNVFFKNKYDLLINVYKKDNIFLKMLSLNVKHDFSIGFTPIDLGLNDIIFDFDPEDINVFSEELTKYLKIISK